MLTLVPPDDCMRAREAVSARLDGELSHLEAQRLEQHLRGCGACREFAGDAEAVVLRVRSAALEPAPEGLFRPRRRRRAAAPFAAVAASLVVAAATGSSFLFGQLLARGGGHGATVVRVTTATAPTTDPGLLAMLRSTHEAPVQRGRVIAL